MVQAEADMKAQLENLLYFVMKAMNVFFVCLFVIQLLITQKTCKLEYHWGLKLLQALEENLC